MTDEALKEADSLDYRFGRAYLHLYKAKLAKSFDLGIEKILEHYAIASELIKPYDDYGKYIIWAEYANMQIRNGEAESGIDLIDKIIRIIPQYIDDQRLVDLYYIKAGALDHLNRPAEASEVMEDAYEIIKNGVPDQFSKIKFAIISRTGRNYSKSGRFREAVNHYHENIRKLDSIFSPVSSVQHYRAKLLGSLARSHCHWGNYDSALMFHRKSIVEFLEDTIMKPSANRIDISNQLEGIGIAFQYKGLYDSALIYFDSSMKIRKQIDDVFGIGMCNDGFGDIYRTWGKYSEALKHLDSALSIKEEYRDQLLRKFGPSRGYSRLQAVLESTAVTLLYHGRLYLDWNKPEQAVRYLQQALEMCREIGYLHGKAEVFTELGNAFSQKYDLVKAEVMYDSAMAIYRFSEELPGIAEVNHRKGILLLAQGDYNGSQSFLRQSLAIYKEAEQKQKETVLLKDLGKIFINQDKPVEAIRLLEESYTACRELNLRQLCMEVAESLANLYLRQGMKSKAYDMLKQYSALKDSIYTLESHRLLSEASARFDLVQKENRLALLTSEKEIGEYHQSQTRNYLIGLSLLLIFSVALSILIIRQIRLRSQQKNLILEQRLLRTQMNPHFIFNALANIQSCMFSNQSEKAGRYLTRLSRLIRNILESSKDEMVYMDKELGSIESYLELQQLRHDGKFSFEIIVDPQIEPSITRIPPMLAQPFIENAVEHGIRHKLAKGFVKVEFIKKEDHISCKVEDNGVGRKKSHELEKDKKRGHRSMATSITAERLETLGRKYKKKLRLTITDLEDEWGEAAGTRVVFTFPFTG